MSNENLLPTDGIKTYFSFDELYGNLDNCITCIIEKLKKGNICAFVGAGFSCNANKSYPDWSTLLIDAYREMHTSKRKSNSAIKNVIRNERETKVAQQYVEFKGHREAIDTYIESKLTPIDCSPKNSLIIHKKLLDLNWADVITTNWDTLLEQAASGEYEVVKTAKQLKVDNHKRIIKVNGSLRSKDDIDAGEYWFDGNFDHLYIITEDDFSSYEQKHNDFSNFMKVEFLENSFCLFGFSGNDPNFQYWIKSLKSLMTKGGKTEEPNPIFMITLNETTDESTKQFYRNNYIVPVFIDDIVQKIRDEMPVVTIKKEAAFIKNITNYPIPLKFDIFFEYLKEMTKEKENTLETQKLLSDAFASIIDRKTEILTESQMIAYNRLDLFDFSNIKYTDYFVGIIRQYVRSQETYPKLFYEFLSRWLASNYYSLHLLFSQDIAQKLVELYIKDFLPEKEAPEFLDHALRYCRECNESLFYKLSTDYTNTEEYSNTICYQNLLVYAQSFDYEKFQKALDEWKPEETKSEYTSLYILRKVYLMLLFENRTMISDCYAEIDNLLTKAEENLNSKTQFAYFLYDLHARILYTMSAEKLESLDKKRSELSTKFASFKQYLAALNFEEINRDAYKPNSDIRYRTLDDTVVRENKAKKQISFARILNFMEYVGCPAYEIITSEQIIDFSYNLKEYAGETTRVLLASLAFFGNSADENVLRKILPLILRSRNSNYLNELFTNVLGIVNYKISTAQRNPKVYIWFLDELIKRCGKDKLDLYTSLFVDGIKGQNEILAALIQKGNIWGVAEPFVYAIEHLQNQDDYCFLLEWVIKEYLADEAELVKTTHFCRSEFEQYYYAFFRNENCKSVLKDFFTQEQVLDLLKEDTKCRFTLLQCAYEYLEDSCELKKETEAYLIQNMSLEIDPYVLTKVSSPKITKAVISTIKNYDFVSWRSTYSSPVSLIQALNQIKVIDDNSKKELSRIIQEKILYLDSHEQKNEYITKQVASAKIALFFMAKELELEGDFVDSLKEFYADQKKDVLSLSWLLNDTTGYARSFEDYLRYCSFTEPTTLDVSIVGICVSKILFTDSVVNESVIKNFADIYICNPLFSFVKSDAINKQIIMIMKKFREDIPYCYDDLFIKEQMTRLAKCMKDDGVVDEAVEYWADEN